MNEEIKEDAASGSAGRGGAAVRHSKQEQEPASAEVLEVAPGILRLQLPANMPGVGHVNCYALCDDDGVALVDPGLPGEESWSAMTARMGAAGIPLKRVHTVVVTHSHIDHYGGCAQLLEETGAVLLTHKAFTVNPADGFSDNDFDGMAEAASPVSGGTAAAAAGASGSGLPVVDGSAAGSRSESDLHRREDSDLGSHGAPSADAVESMIAGGYFDDLVSQNVESDDDIIDFEDLAADDTEIVPARARHRQLYGAASEAGETVGPGITPWGPSHHLHPKEAIKLWLRSGRGGDIRRLIAGLKTPQPTSRLDNGAVLKLAGREWFVVHTPGHTVDHLCLWDPEEGVLLAGDHVLPTITPHIAGSAESHDLLADFLDSLRRVESFEGVTVCLPAHGHPFTGLSDRTRSIRCHHAEQLGLLRAAAEDLSDAPVEAFMQVLFRPRAWGYLAASETFAHLEHLRSLGEATSRRDRVGLMRYNLQVSPSKVEPFGA